MELFLHLKASLAAKCVRSSDHISLQMLCIILVFMSLVMAAELVKHFFPKMVDLHNYTPAHSTHQKLTNWNMLNRQADAFVFSQTVIKSILMVVYDPGAASHTPKGINKPFGYISVFSTNYIFLLSQCLYSNCHM